MTREISVEDLNVFIEKNYSSKLEFAKALNISNSHLHGLLKAKVKLGRKVFMRLEALMRLKGYEIESILHPVPINMDGCLYREILILKDDELISSITSKDFIVEEGYKVVCVPYKAQRRYLNEVGYNPRISKNDKSDQAKYQSID